MNRPGRSETGGWPVTVARPALQAVSRRLSGLGAVAGLCLLSALFAPALAQVRNGPPSVAPVAERLIDAVVNISTKQTLKGSEGAPLPKVPKGAPFEEFFDDFFDRKENRSPDRKVTAQGSGFVVDGKEGLIVTNNHVIDGADEIVINFNDGSKLVVEKILGKDPKTDLALLKVTPKRALAQVAFGSSSRLKVGDWVMAIGNPFGLGGSVSVGIISAKQRDINTGPYDDFLQTDAAINRGNSGGPLFNMDGEVIGVNTAIISPSGGSIGIGFAVPSDSAVVVLEQLRLFGETRRGWLGVNVQSVTEDLAEATGIREGTGARVASVAPEGPAAKAGILQDDVIVRFDGKDVTSMRGLPRLVSQTQICKEVEIEVSRKGQRRTFRVTIGRLVEEVKPAAKTGVRVPPKSRSKGKDKDGNVAPRRSLAGLAPAHG
ncbi:MAG TPA: trypsin-like peptidase domain-containing protein [Hyphomicrobiaceae bacterium]|nr:trypsin-like peptidase domain-containing protein [Hyphomicrobiaceae bacterium]